MRCIFFLHFINSNLIKDVLKKILELRQKLKKKTCKEMHTNTYSDKPHSNFVG